MPPSLYHVAAKTVKAISDHWYSLDSPRNVSEQLAPLVVVPFAQIGGQRAQLRLTIRMETTEFLKNFRVKRNPVAGSAFQSGLLSNSLRHPGRIGGVIARHLSPKVFRL